MRLFWGTASEPLVSNGKGSKISREPLGLLKKHLGLLKKHHQRAAPVMKCFSESSRSVFAAPVMAFTLLHKHIRYLEMQPLVVIID